MYLKMELNYIKIQSNILTFTNVKKHQSNDNQIVERLFKKFHKTIESIKKMNNFVTLKFKFIFLCFKR